jgi:CheY-like chemotaxis protein
MDLQMPEMDGFTATREIRERLPAERQPRIIALTANALRADRDACVAAGMDDFVSKPVKLDDITESIRRQFTTEHQ